MDPLSQALEEQDKQKENTESKYTLDVDEITIAHKKSPKPKPKHSPPPDEDYELPRAYPQLTTLNRKLNTSQDDPDMPKAPKISFQERVKVYRDAIQGPEIQVETIRLLSFKGIPEERGLRAIYWKLLLGYLPLNRGKWESAVQNSRNLYNSWLEELILDPHDRPNKVLNSAEKIAVDISCEDHPLNTSQNSKWGKYFKDREMMEEIDKDIRRTFPHLHFFHEGEQTEAQHGTGAHLDALRRILFIYAKLNIGIRYVQGMNEILGPIYYLFATDPDAEVRKYAEADAFFCFQAVMAEIMNNFCKTLDQSEIGVKAEMTKLNNLLKIKDPELWNHFNIQGMNPQFYSFRWITLLLSQEFDLPDVLRLWDTLFADKMRFDFLLYCCCAMLRCVRDELLANEFPDNLKLLQDYPKCIDVSLIIAEAMRLKQQENEQQQEIPRAVTPSNPSPVESPTRPQPKSAPRNLHSSGGASEDTGIRKFLRLFVGSHAVEEKEMVARD